jgi:DNA-binding MarR family transcriptional regulator
MPDRAETFRLYGRRRVPRSHRRVMLALLTGAPELGITEIARLAQCGFSSAVLATARMEGRGWLERQHFGEFHRVAWHLTPEGRACVTLLLGLEAPRD